ncbi:uncharacterized protein LOC132205086 [Neocloeon triangulifer]|uniref:uncharacterized protein LOC132205086 n=1 Tax=Neocloeon triangulifer TaxID=2078957 RepID=UPI00286EF62B|nr:uncharacterized protein LOC132205086 [Neocloeon triangulifer]
MLKATALLLIFSFLCQNEAFPSYYSFKAEDIVGGNVVEKIHSLIYSVEEIQIFELANAPTFFPIGRDFFELIEYLHLLNIDRYTIQDIRDYAFKEVRAIHKLIYEHEMKISEFVELLANTAFHVRSRDNEVEKLVRDLRGIEDASTALIIDVWGIIVRIESLSEEFAFRMEDAILAVDVKIPNALDEIRERVTNLGQSYVDKYDGFANLMENVQQKFGDMLQALVLYIDLAKEEAKHQILDSKN